MNNQIWTLKHLCELFNINSNIYQENSEIFLGEVQFNSKDIKVGDIFIALQGTKANGHDYVNDAFKNGAAIAIVSQEVFSIPKNKLIFVKDTYNALKVMAQARREESQAKFIAITGSAGKTTTKDSIHEVLSHYAKTYKSRKNFNNELGLYINLASMPKDVEFSVIELGMNAIGEIRNLTNILKPDIALITNIGEAHLEFFDSTDQIAEAKGEIFEGLKQDGIAIINQDNKYYEYLISHLAKLKIKNILKFGESFESNIQLEKYVNKTQHTKISIKIFDEEKIIYCTSIISKHLALNHTKVLAVVEAVKLDNSIACKILSKITAPYGRGKIIKFEKFSIIDDCYNANPLSFKASLEFLATLATSQKILFLGDMRELGETSAQLHLGLIPYIQNCYLNQIFCIGQMAKLIYENLTDNIIKYQFDNVEDCLARLPTINFDQNIILIKGSKSTGLVKIMNYFEANFKEVTHAI